MQNTLVATELDDEISILPHSGCGEHSHFVQFYDNDSALTGSVAEFVAAGLKAGDRAVIIATPDHLNSLENELREQGFIISSLRDSGQYSALDAEETLSTFMVDDTPDPKLFRDTVGSVIARAGQGARPVRAFGEMVALLWAEGKKQAAIELEELWNDLAKSHSFALLCGYPLREFAGASNSESFQEVCRAHSRVIPAESYGKRNATADERGRTIALLQQKAASLEQELAVRKRAEKALFQREQELSDFLENATEAIHKVGADGEILWANRAELDLLGYPQEKYIGRNIAEFHEDPDVISDILARLTRGEKLRDYETRLKHADGSIRWVSINSSVYWDDDCFGHTKCFTRDITERKRAAEVLERTVAERTRQLQETVAELEAFSYSVSHDMRSPLRAMEGYAKALLRDNSSSLPPQSVLYLQRIQRASNRLDLLIRDVLAFSKISKGEIELKPIALGPLLEDIILQHPELETARSQIQIVSSLHTVLGHEAYLTQVVTNLLANALKFVAPGTVPQIQVRSEPEGPWVRVWICDNGIGIHPQHHDRIFQIFGRVYSEKEFPGTGIGLAVVKKAVSRMGGKTGFNSAPGQGSQFWFTLLSA